MKDKLSAYALVAVALVASLIGGAVGAYVSTGGARESAAAVSSPTPAAATPAALVAQPSSPAPIDSQTIDLADEAAELNAEARADAPRGVTRTRPDDRVQVASARKQSRGKARPSTRRVYYTSDARQAAPARSYYEYKKPSFWSRHRDLMTIAIGTGVGTGIGAIAGGGKGAAIGALAGGGGTGVYTLVRRRQRN
jgi:hypothetical protein